MRVPRISADNYLVRFSSAITMEDEDVSFIQYPSQWPAVVPVGSKATNLHSCPNDMHMVLWGASQPTTLRMYSLEYSRRLSPLPSSDGTVPAHHIAFAWDGFEDSSDRDSSPPHIELTLDAHDVLFVPRSYVVSLRLDSGHGLGVALRNCFVDASNIRQFISALSVEAMVSPSSRALLDAISSADYDASHTAFSMERNPRDLSLAEYFSYPREEMLCTSSERKNGQVTFKGTLFLILETSWLINICRLAGVPAVAAASRLPHHVGALGPLPRQSGA